MESVFSVLTSIVDNPVVQTGTLGTTVAAVASAVLPSRSPNKWVNLVFKVFNTVAFNIGRARNADDPRS